MFRFVEIVSQLPHNQPLLHGCGPAQLWWCGQSPWARWGPQTSEAQQRTHRQLGLELQWMPFKVNLIEKGPLASFAIACITTEIHQCKTNRTRGHFHCEVGSLDVTAQITKGFEVVVPSDRHGLWGDACDSGPLRRCSTITPRHINPAELRVCFIQA